MPERLSPQRAEATLDTLWDNAAKQVVKLAMLQDGSPMMDADTLRSWENGDFGHAICLISQNPAVSNFTAMTARKTQQGLSVSRLHYVAEGSLRQDKPGYLDLLIEMFRRQHVPHGHENVYLFGPNMCADLAMPPTDTALFDRSIGITTYYKLGAVSHREIYDAGTPTDRPWIEANKKLTDTLLTRLHTRAHKLEPVPRGDTTTWRDTVGQSWLTT